MTRTSLILAIAATLLITAPVGAYTVYLKDGAKLIAKEPPEIRGETALIILQNGTQTSLAASEIDIERTRQANQSELGSALILEGGEFTDQLTVPEPERERRLTDVTSRRPTPRASAAPARRSTPTRRTTESATGGGIDLRSADRTPYRDLEVAAEIQGVFRGQEVDQTRLYQGTARDRILIDLTTDSEAAVFRGIKVAAAALVHLQSKAPRVVNAFELVLTTSDRTLAGQFVLDAESAQQLTSGELEPSTFFVERVRF